jgi:hypothetical protein
VTDVQIFGVPKSHDRISQTRDWILRELPKLTGEDVILQFDDDMDFCYRPKVDEPTLLTVETPERMLDMLGTLERWIVKDGFMHVGLSARQGNNRPFNNEAGEYALHPYRDATRMVNAYAYDTKRLFAIKDIDVSRNQVMHDFDLTLQLLRRGHPNRVMFEYCWNQRGSGADGGCSTYRDGSMQEASARQLAADHPDFVKVVVKKSKDTSASWKGMKERYDVTVRWRDAFASSGKELPK